MRKFLLVAAIVLTNIVIHAQVKKPLKDRSFVYFSVGTERVFYTPSNIRFVSDKGQSSFDFTIHKARAHDDGGLSFVDDAPQYSYNFGYYSARKKFGVEFQFDHVKYIVRPNQSVRLKGAINGQQYDKDTMLVPTFVQFEHTDGANYAMLSYVKQKNLVSSKNQKHLLDLVMKAGAGPVIPKTNSTIIGVKYDDEYAISGYVIGLETGLRYNLFKYAFLTASFKTAYANYRKFIIANGHGNQQWLSGQFNIMAGIQVPF